MPYTKLGRLCDIADCDMTASLVVVAINLAMENFGRQIWWHGSCDLFRRRLTEDFEELKQFSRMIL